MKMGIESIVNLSPKYGSLNK